MNHSNRDESLHYVDLDVGHQMSDDIIRQTHYTVPEQSISRSVPTKGSKLKAGYSS